MNLNALIFVLAVGGLLSLWVFLVQLAARQKAEEILREKKRRDSVKKEAEQQAKAAQENKFKLRRREGTLLEEIPGLPSSFVEFMKSLGYDNAEGVWCAMHAVPDSFKREICPEHQMDARELEKTLRAYVPQSLQDEQFKMTGNEWAADGPEKPDEIGYNEATFPANGNTYVFVGSKLPDSVTVASGRCLVFVRYSELFGGNWIKKGPTLPAQDFLRVLMPIENGQVAVTLPDQPDDTDVVAVFQVKAAPGSFGDIEIQFAPPNPMCDPYPPEKFQYFVD